MRDRLLEFLKVLERIIPPPENCHHVICYGQYGSDAEGWTDKLCLQVNRDGVFHCFFLDEQDCQQLSLTVDTICKAMAESAPPAAQLGVSAGKFV